MDMANGLRRMTYQYKNGTKADLYVPPTHAHKLMRQMAEREGAQATTREGIAGRRIDQQVTGRIVAMPRDARDARNDKPLFVADVRPGKMTRLVMGMGMEHTGALLERLSEEDHYQGTTFERPEGYERPDIQGMWHDAMDMGKRAHAGRKTFGAQKQRD